VARVVDLTPEGFAFEAQGYWRPGDELTFTMKLPTSDGFVHETALHATVRSTRRIERGRQRVGCLMTTLDPVATERLVEYCYVVKPLSELRGAGTVAAAPESTREPLSAVS
jgi:hypothetical protein